MVDAALCPRHWLKSAAATDVLIIAGTCSQSLVKCVRLDLATGHVFERVHLDVAEIDVCKIEING